MDQATETDLKNSQEPTVRQQILEDLPRQLFRPQERLVKSNSWAAESVIFLGNKEPRPDRVLGILEQKLEALKEKITETVEDNPELIITVLDQALEDSRLIEVSELSEIKSSFSFMTEQLALPQYASMPGKDLLDQALAELDDNLDYYMDNCYDRCYGDEVVCEYGVSTGPQAHREIVLKNIGHHKGSATINLNRGDQANNEILEHLEGLLNSRQPHSMTRQAFHMLQEQVADAVVTDPQQLGNGLQPTTPLGHIASSLSSSGEFADIVEAIDTKGPESATEVLRSTGKLKIQLKHATIKTLEVSRDRGYSYFKLTLDGGHEVSFRANSSCNDLLSLDDQIHQLLMEIGDDTSESVQQLFSNKPDQSAPSRSRGIINYLASIGELDKLTGNDNLSLNCDLIGIASSPDCVIANLTLERGSTLDIRGNVTVFNLKMDKAAVLNLVTLNSSFVNCDLSGAVLTGSFGSSSFDNCKFVSTDAIDCDLRDIQLKQSSKRYIKENMTNMLINDAHAPRSIVKRSKRLSVEDQLTRLNYIDSTVFNTDRLIEKLVATDQTRLHTEVTSNEDNSIKLVNIYNRSEQSEEDYLQIRIAKQPEQADIVQVRRVRPEHKGLSAEEVEAQFFTPKSKAELFRIVTVYRENDPDQVELQGGQPAEISTELNSDVQNFIDSQVKDLQERIDQSQILTEAFFRDNFEEELRAAFTADDSIALEFRRSEDEFEDVLKTICEELVKLQKKPEDQQTDPDEEEENKDSPEKAQHAEKNLKEDPPESNSPIAKIDNARLAAERKCVDDFYDQLLAEYRESRTNPLPAVNIYSPVFSLDVFDDVLTGMYTSYSDPAHVDLGRVQLIKMEVQEKIDHLLGPPINSKEKEFIQRMVQKSIDEKDPEISADLETMLRGAWTNTPRVSGNNAVERFERLVALARLEVQERNLQQQEEETTDSLPQEQLTRTEIITAAAEQVFGDLQQRYYQNRMRPSQHDNYYSNRFRYGFLNPHIEEAYKILANVTEVDEQTISEIKELVRAKVKSLIKPKLNHFERKFTKALVVVASNKADYTISPALEEKFKKIWARRQKTDALRTHERFEMIMATVRLELVPVAKQAAKTAENRQSTGEQNGRPPVDNQDSSSTSAEKNSTETTTKRELTAFEAQFVTTMVAHCVKKNDYKLSKNNKKQLKKLWERGQTDDELKTSEHFEELVAVARERLYKQLEAELNAIAPSDDYSNDPFETVQLDPSEANRLPSRPEASEDDLYFNWGPEEIGPSE